MSPASAAGWRLRVVHRTVHTYEAEVRTSYNEARLSPQSGPGQTVLDTRVDVSPNAPVTTYRDYWGTTVNVFDLHQPHQRLTVTGTSLVDTRGPAPRDEPGTWGAVETDEVADRWCEVLAPSRFVQWDEEIGEVAAGIKAAAATPLAAVDAAAEWVRSALTYRKGATHVGTTALEARAAGVGVCQDFAHLSLAVLRAAGVPARYVSGYFYPKKDAEVGEEVAGESHAWVEAWIGRWYPFDPTNGSEVRPRHVSVARGRDYKDVSPLKGVYSGGGAGTPTVTVELTRTA
jgi:transglutaminase-like putative cysteine protease